MNITDDMTRAAVHAWETCRIPTVFGAMRAALSAALAAQPQPAAQWLPHSYAGDCPDDLQPDARDPECPACRAMDAQPAERVPLTEEEIGAMDWSVPQPGETGALPAQIRNARAVERECAKRWGITLADTEG